MTSDDSSSASDLDAIRAAAADQDFIGPRQSSGSPDGPPRQSDTAPIGGTAGQRAGTGGAPTPDDPDGTDAGTTPTPDEAPNRDQTSATAGPDPSDQPQSSDMGGQSGEIGQPSVEDIREAAAEQDAIAPEQPTPADPSPGPGGPEDAPLGGPSGERGGRGGFDQTPTADTRAEPDIDDSEPVVDDGGSEPSGGMDTGGAEPSGGFGGVSGNFGGPAGQPFGERGRPDAAETGGPSRPSGGQGGGGGPVGDVTRGADVEEIREAAAEQDAIAPEQPGDGPVAAPEAPPELSVASERRTVAEERAASAERRRENRAAPTEGPDLSTASERRTTAEQKRATASTALDDRARLEQVGASQEKMLRKAEAAVEAETGKDLTFGRDFVVRDKQERAVVEFTERGREQLEDEEQLGDFDTEVSFQRGAFASQFGKDVRTGPKRTVDVEEAIREVPEAVGEFARERMGPPGSSVQTDLGLTDEEVRELNEERTFTPRERAAQRFGREASVGLVTGGPALATSIVTNPLEVAETATFVGGAPAGERGERVEKVGEVTAGRVSRTVEFARTNPAKFGGQVTGSALASLPATAGAIGQAQRLAGPRTGRAVSFAVQPGEELAISAARAGAIPKAAATKVPGVREGHIGDIDVGPSKSFLEAERGTADLTGTESRRVKTETEEDIAGTEPVPGGDEGAAARQRQAQRATREVTAFEKGELETPPGTETKTPESDFVSSGGPGGEFTASRTTGGTQTSTARRTRSMSGPRGPQTEAFRAADIRTERETAGRVEAAQEQRAEVGGVDLPMSSLVEPSVPLESVAASALALEDVSAQQVRADTTPEIDVDIGVATDIAPRADSVVEPDVFARTDTRTDTRSEQRRETRTEQRTETRTESRTETRTESRTEPRSESRTESRTETRTEPRNEPGIESIIEPSSESISGPTLDQRDEDMEPIVDPALDAFDKRFVSDVADPDEVLEEL